MSNFTSSWVQNQARQETGNSRAVMSIQDILYLCSCSIPQLFSVCRGGKLCGRNYGWEYSMLKMKQLRNRETTKLACSAGVFCRANAHFLYYAAILDLVTVDFGARKKGHAGRGRGKKSLFPSPLPPRLPIFLLNTYSLGKYFLAPILHSYQIQDGGLIRKCALVRQNTPALQATTK